MKEELYINDMMVDIDKDVDIYPVYQSPLLTDLKSIVSNRSNDISLPLTPHNAKIIQMYHLADTTDYSESFPREWCSVRYYRNGFVICEDGLGTLTSVSGGRINFTFTWGASSKLQRLFDKKLSDLSLPADIPWSEVTAFGYCSGYSNKCGYFQIDYGMGKYIAPINFIHPCLTSNYIISTIIKDNEIKIDARKLNRHFLIPCMHRPIESFANPAQYFDLKKGVPDMKQSDFLKAIMQIHGVFAYLKDDDTIGFLSFKDVCESSNYFDWTDKVIMSSNVFTAPESMEFSLDGLGQRNTFKYTEDDDAKENSGYNGFIRVWNKTSEKEKEAVKLPFNYTKNKEDEDNICAAIGMYKKEGENISINDNLKPRILVKGDSNEAYFPKDLKWSNILNNSNYVAYKKVVNTPRVLKIKCLLTDWDLAHIDFSYPVLFRQYGHKYAIIKIEAKAGNVCDCSFLQIN